MSVVVHRADVRVVFCTPDGWRERSTVRLFIAENRSDAIDATLRLAKRVLRMACEFPADGETMYKLGSVRLGIKSIDAVGEDGCSEHTDTGWSVDTTAGLAWKCDYPGTLEQYAEAAR